MMRNPLRGATRGQPRILSGDCFSCFLDLDTWRNYVSAAGFSEVPHYYRPPGSRATSSRGLQPYGAKANRYPNIGRQ